MTMKSTTLLSAGLLCLLVTGEGTLAQNGNGNGLFKNNDTLTAEMAQAFIDEQFLYYFTDCQKFVDTFAHKFEYCDFAPGIKLNKDGCFTKKDDLLEACLETQGAPTTLYQLDPQPVFTGTTSSYYEVAIKGFQKVDGVPTTTETGDIAFLNLCFDFVIVEDMVEAPDAALGVKSSFWKGYFSVELCDIPGLPDCVCNSLTPLVSYNN